MQKNGVNKRVRVGLIAVMVLLASALTVLALAGCTTNSAGDQKAADAPPPGSAPESGSVKITIDITNAVNAGDETAKGIADRTGTNTYNAIAGVEGPVTVLVATQNCGLDVTTSSNEFGQFITSIDGLATGAVDVNAGWAFTVNGKAVPDQADVATVNPGDTITWTYTIDWKK